MVSGHILVALTFLALASFVLASDPSSLQDFCVAIDEPENAVFLLDAYRNLFCSVFVNGKFCKNPKLVTAEDFLLKGLNMPGNTSNPLGSFVTPANVAQLPGLNTLEGLVHFQFNIGKTKAVAFAGLSSQNPGVITIANAVFGSNLPISDDVLAKAFQVDKKVVDWLQAQFWMDIN
ncbi:Germin-like protein subfamily 1 member [Thalictrum thalictroides]|uniref:Germin-like protein n=1 Tax=Thalictrum thalictroides TaxID=46969 RepID=A0A7J6WT69_THATH|nr:Germin-like protein subfamily 1 member [Thalictrum thalictroides]